MQSLAEFLGTHRTEDESLEPTELPQLTVKDFCRGVLESCEYRQSVLDRVRLGSLPPAVELMMYARAYGAVPDRVEHVGDDGGPIEVITRVVRIVVDADGREVGADGNEADAHMRKIVH